MPRHNLYLRLEPHRPEHYAPRTRGAAGLCSECDQRASFTAVYPTRRPPPGQGAGTQVRSLCPRHALLARKSQEIAQAGARRPAAPRQRGDCAPQDGPPPAAATRARLLAWAGTPAGALVIASGHLTLTGRPRSRAGHAPVAGR